MTPGQGRAKWRLSLIKIEDEDEFEDDYDGPLPRLTMISRLNQSCPRLP